MPSTSLPVDVGDRAEPGAHGVVMLGGRWERLAAAHVGARRALAVGGAAEGSPVARSAAEPVWAVWARRPLR